MKKILLSAFACAPGKGSEEGGGWNWATELAKLGYEVHCITRSASRQDIETTPPVPNLHFYYVEVPIVNTNLNRMGLFIYPYYLSWQYLAYKKAKKLHSVLKFDIAHHVSWGSTQMGSWMYKLNIPFIFGPAGGGQHAPVAFKKYFGDKWAEEEKREKVSNILVKFNPACKTMLRKAHTVLVPNTDTMDLVKSIGAKNVGLSFDAALPDTFFPKTFKPKAPASGTLNLLWVGRFMPRKGLILTLDVMRELRETHPNIKLTVVGYGELEDQIKTYIEQNQLQNTVTLTGKVPYQQVRDYYESHDIFFFTSLRDSGPAQVLEAFAFGMPIVTIKLHGQAILVSDETGIRCSVDSPEKTIAELKDALIYLYDNPQKVTEMSYAAMKFGRTQAWPEKIAGITRNYYPQ
ncbi:glycosyltransferase family 4 protein [Mucilaginibacter ximonensis]|uniref:Glycosyltransferase family 4 protein n=1 Tax=Mucilaginibacter ximonensis TaxID=538021 RepID=A0ABW5YBN3_9SPHI